jgi:hypothetical protein
LKLSREYAEVDLSILKEANRQYRPKVDVIRIWYNDNALEGEREVCGFSLIRANLEYLSKHHLHLFVQDSSGSKCTKLPLSLEKQSIEILLSFCMPRSLQFQQGTR